MLPRVPSGGRQPLHGGGGAGLPEARGVVRALRGALEGTLVGLLERVVREGRVLVHSEPLRLLPGREGFRLLRPPQLVPADRIRGPGVL